MRKLIILDLDGTLLNDDKEISYNSLKFLRQLNEAGHVVTICTGRPLLSARCYGVQLSLNVPLIVHSGAMICDLHNKVYMHNKVDVTLAHRFLDFCWEKNLPCSVYTRDAIHMLFESATLRAVHEYFDKMRPPVISDVGEILAKPPTRFVVVVPGATKFKDAYQRLKSEFRNELRIVQSGENMIDVTDISVSKGSSMLLLAKKLGFRAEEIIAIGDNHNDLEMLAYAGTSVAMGNADELVKAHATYQTLTNNDEGVIFILRKLLAS